MDKDAPARPGGGPHSRFFTISLPGLNHRASSSWQHGLQVAPGGTNTFPRLLAAILAVGLLPGAAAHSQEAASSEAPIVQSGTFFRTSSSRRRRFSTTSRRRRGSATTRSGSRRTSGACGTPASWTTSCSTSRTGPRGRSSTSWCRSGAGSRSSTTAGARRHDDRTSRTSSRRRKPQIKIDTFYDPAKARQGRRRSSRRCWTRRVPLRDGQARREEPGGAGFQISFIIDDGPKARVKTSSSTGTTSSPTGSSAGR